jgi:hypothetical protein
MTSTFARQFARFTFVFAASALACVTAWAEEKVQVSFQLRCTFGKPTELKIADTEGHTMALVENKCVNKSVGKIEFLDQAEALLQVARDYIKGSGPAQGYVILNKGADSATLKWSGNTVTTPLAEGAETQFSGMWTFVVGTGQWQNLKSGSGIFSGRRISSTELDVLWAGALMR